jgi:esterase/lipase superfamily enzyme
MGNFALGAAVTAWFAAGNEGTVLFDEVILAAADEAAQTFIQPDSSRLTRLPELSSRISIYTSRRDIAMSLSQGVNNDIRLGFDGPAQKGDPALYPPARFPPATFRTIDCTEVYDYSAIFPIDATHQYYRRSKTVRVDITAVMSGLPVRPGQSALSIGPFG